MRHTLRCIGCPASNTNQCNRQLLVTYIISHLFITSVKEKRYNVVHVHLETRHGKSSSKACHVLLSNTKIKKSIGITYFEFIKYPKSSISAYEKNVLSCLACVNYCVNKCISHNLEFFHQSMIPFCFR